MKEDWDIIQVKTKKIVSTPAKTSRKFFATYDQIDLIANEFFGTRGVFCSGSRGEAVLTSDRFSIRFTNEWGSLAEESTNCFIIRDDYRSGSRDRIVIFDEDLRKKLLLRNFYYTKGTTNIVGNISDKLRLRVEQILGL